MQNLITKTPPPPYYVVVFSAVLSPDLEGYENMASKMIELANQQPGFLGYEYAGGELEITISYWKNLESIKQWGLNSDHMKAKDSGKKLWFQDYRIRIALVEKDSFYDQL